LSAEAVPTIEASSHVIITTRHLSDQYTAFEKHGVSENDSGSFLMQKRWEASQPGPIKANLYQWTKPVGFPQFLPADWDRDSLRNVFLECCV